MMYSSDTPDWRIETDRLQEQINELKRQIIMKRWEYLIEKFPMPDKFKWPVGFDELDDMYTELIESHRSRLIDLGNEGWEHYHQMNGYFYFKRSVES